MSGSECPVTRTANVSSYPSVDQSDLWTTAFSLYHWLVNSWHRLKKLLYKKLATVSCVKFWHQVHASSCTDFRGIELRYSAHEAGTQNN